MLKKCYSIGKAYYQTSDNEAGYQKRVQLTLGVFGFDHGCSVHTKIHGYLYRFRLLVFFCQIFTGESLVLDTCKYESFIELYAGIAGPFSTL